MKHETIQPSEKLPIPCPNQSRKVTLRSANVNKHLQSTSIQRRSLNISHYNALHDAVSNLARIDDFDLEELGYGFFSDVFKATHNQTKQVLVLKRNKDTNSKMNILREIQLMNRLSHPNILKFRGVCVHEGKLHALTEFINGGDLDRFVTNKDIVLPWKQRMNLALDIARGINYLHSKGIFHRDLSSKNCLVQVEDRRGKKKYTCIVADLGLAEKIPTTPDQMARLAMVGTPYTMAPEVLRGKPYNETADVFSFGLIICQLIALVSFDPEQLPRSQDFGLACDLFQKMVAGPSPPDTDVDIALPPPNSFLQLAYDCCQIEPCARPSFKEIVSRLEGMVFRRNHATPTASFKVRGGDITCHRSRAGHNTVGSSKTNHLSPLLSPKRVRVNSMSKLTRSYSDISRELIQHAASVAYSTWDEEGFSEESEDDGFSNPFEEIEHLNCNHKLIDEPSLALFEMTFDLASTESLKNPLCHRRRNSSGRDRRPNSTDTDGKLKIEHEHIDHHHHHYQANPISSSPVHPHSRTQKLRSSEEQNRRSPRVSCSEELVSRCGDCNLQRARHRAMILSPLGNHLASRLSSRRGNSKEDVELQRQSLATVMSVFSRGLLNLRRSISVPDFLQASSLFHHVDAEAENRILHALDIPPDSVGYRSSSDELFSESHGQNTSNTSVSFQNLSQSSSSNAIVDSNTVRKNSSDLEKPLLLPLDSTLIDTVNNDSPNTNTPNSESLDTSLKSEILTEQLHDKNRSEMTLLHEGLEQTSTHSVPECVVADLSQPPKSNNRDSGYEESLSIPQSITELTPNRKWSIPEEIVPVL